MTICLRASLRDRRIFVLGLLLLAGSCAAADFGQTCEAASDCATGFCYQGYCLKRVCNNDGAVQPGELCDDGNSSDNDACLTTCKPATCGDGHVRRGLDIDDPGYEECDPEASDGGRECRTDCLLAQDDRRIASSWRGLTWFGRDRTFGSPSLYVMAYGRAGAGDRQAFVCDDAEVQSLQRTLRFEPVHVESMFEAFISTNSWQRVILRGGGNSAAVETVWGGSNSDLFTVAPGARQWTFSYQRDCLITREGLLSCWEATGDARCQLSREAAAAGETQWRFEDSTITAMANGDTTVCAINRDGEVLCRGATRSWHDLPHGLGRAGPNAMLCEDGPLPEHPACSTCSGLICSPCQNDADCEEGEACWAAPAEGGAQFRHCVPEAHMAAIQTCVGRGEERRIQLSEPIVELVANTGTYLGRAANGSVYQWGKSLGGSGTEPSLVGLPVRAVQLGIAGSIACALGEDAGVYCWGDGQPARAMNLPAPMAEISAGGHFGRHLCGIDSEGAIGCWALERDESLNCLARRIDPTWGFEMWGTP